MAMVDFVGLTPAEQKQKCKDSLVYWLDKQSIYRSKSQEDKAKDCEAPIRFYRDRIKALEK